MGSMWSRNNVVWLRRRWACREDDPGREARLSPSSSTAGRRSHADAVRHELLAGSIVVECPHRGCAGMLLTGSREIEWPGGTGARLTFRCTREPQSHEVVVTMDPYTPEEVESLKALLYRGEQLACVRCGTVLSLGSQSSQDGWAKSLDSDAAFYCSWCGVKWVAPTELTRRAS